MRNLILLYSASLFFVSTSLVHAHEEDLPHHEQLWGDWFSEPFALASLVLTITFYLRGLIRLRRAVPQSPPTSDILCFSAGWLTLFVALESPLHPLGELLFSAHMVQHELLMLAAAPLLILSRPLPIFLSSLPKSWARRLAGAARRQPWHSVWKLITNPFVAWLVHALVLWSWHLPFLFQAATENEWIHILQHFSFFGSALLFWWAVIQGSQRAFGFGMAVLYMFTTALHSGVLGALLTFSGSLWYPIYSETTAPWGLNPLEDQQLGGLVMWIPAGLIYIGAGLALFVGWMRESGRRVRLREAGQTHIAAE